MSKSDSSDGPRHQTLVQLLRTSEAIWSTSRSFFAQWDLSPSQFNVLNLLNHDKEMTQIELSRHLITHRSNVTGLVDRLEKRGLVSRKQVPGDRRAFHVRLTPAGQKVLNDVLPEYKERAENALSKISLKQLSLLKHQLKSIEETVVFQSSDVKIQ